MISGRHWPSHCSSISFVTAIASSTRAAMRQPSPGPSRPSSASSASMTPACLPRRASIWATSPADSVSRATATMWWTGLSSFGQWHVKSAGSKMPTLSGMAWRRPG